MSSAIRKDTEIPEGKWDEMKIVNVMEAGQMPTPHGVKVSRIYDTEHAQAVHITLEPGEFLKRHITPVDVFFYVLEGTGIVEIGDEKREVKRDTLVESPKDIPHAWANESQETFRVLVVKVPRPTTSTKVLG
jgi:quercetin dioxygenase-like cupin family protein